MPEIAAKSSNYAKNWGLCLFFWIMLFEADYAKNYASILYQCLAEKLRRSNSVAGKLRRSNSVAEKLRRSNSVAEKLRRSNSVAEKLRRSNSEAGWLGPVIFYFRLELFLVWSLRVSIRRALCRWTTSIPAIQNVIEVVIPCSQVQTPSDKNIPVCWTVSWSVLYIIFICLSGKDHAHLIPHLIPIDHFQWLFVVRLVGITFWCMWHALPFNSDLLWKVRRYVRCFKTCQLAEYELLKLVLEAFEHSAIKTKKKRPPVY